MWNEINKQSKLLVSSLKNLSYTISTAESCTGGLLASSIISNSGASNIYEKGFITYSNQSKTEILNVDSDLLISYGAVSKETCLSMLSNLIKISKCKFGVSITGIAGPGGGSKKKPVGLVWIGFGCKNNFNAQRYIFNGNRLEIRLKATLESITNVNNFIKKYYL